MPDFTPEEIKAAQGRETQKRKFWWLPLVVIPVVAVIVIAIAFSNLHPSDSSAADSKYTQTWAKDYSKTTCADWNDEMTTAQQFAASADILSAARDKIDGASGVAPDDLIEEFSHGISTACAMPTATLTDITYLLYSSEPKFHP